MGIAPYKTFTFDGVSSSTYGVYLTGKGVFNAPERAVEMIEVPGRNGTFALDQGRFQNIQVTYKIGMFDVNETNFATKVSNFRNWLCSKVGYVRLSDEYNPDEYRMAVYSGGLELKHDLLIAGEAEITFDCRPQRWLTSGETPVAIANSGDTITNPTLFDAEPVLALEGTGDITINGQTININNDPYGSVVLLNADSGVSMTKDRTLNVSLMDIGDTFEGGGYVVCGYYGKSGYSVQSVTVTSSSGCTVEQIKANELRVYLQTFTHTYGTSGYSAQGTINVNVVVKKISDSSTATTSKTINVSTNYNGNNIIYFAVTTSAPSNTNYQTQYHYDTITGNSTKTPIGDTIYIDMSIGEAWTVENDEIISANSAVSLGSDLMTLPPGATAVTFDNTITSLAITPNWWKV